MHALVRRLCANKLGATAIEYGLLAALLAVATIAGLSMLGTTLNTEFGNVATSLQNAG
jgi:pilus assembly protein Flp/PilA